jgi:hypothetical protein
MTVASPSAERSVGAWGDRLRRALQITGAAARVEAIADLSEDLARSDPGLCSELVREASRPLLDRRPSFIACSDLVLASVDEHCREHGLEQSAPFVVEQWVACLQMVFGAGDFSAAERERARLALRTLRTYISIP